MKKLFFTVFLILIFTGSALTQDGGGVKKKRPLPHEYGRVIIDNYKVLWLEKSSLGPVVFEHWLHRAVFTCRVCHVDIGFAMKAGATKITASDNTKGFYCGACHNGKMVHNDRKVFESCSENFKREDMVRCTRCHSFGKKVKKEYDFAVFTKDLPRERFGNGIDWEKAEAAGLIKPLDFIEGFSVKRPPLKVQKDFSLEAKIEGMPDIIYSHEKHTIWNGCEGCHPEIFFGIKKGLTKYSMVDIFEGKYCGACHGQVAFPLLDCQRCHTKAIQ